MSKTINGLKITSHQESLPDGKSFVWKASVEGFELTPPCPDQQAAINDAIYLIECGNFKAALKRKISSLSEEKKILECKNAINVCSEKIEKLQGCLRQLD